MQDDVSTVVERLRALGQSVWIDDLSREMLAGGQLAALVERGVTGVTANPTTFDKAVTGTDLYDRDIKRMAGEHTPGEILWELLVDDVREAADVLRPIHAASGGEDGFVSIEVSPDIAHDTEATIQMTRQLWQRCDRPNVLVKIPGTAAGLPAISQMIAEGINVNVTLIFSVRRYAQVVDAYFSGLETRLAGGGSAGDVVSVASFFVSRVNTKIDARLRELAERTPEPNVRELARSLLGQIGIANSKLAFHRFGQLHAGPRWERLVAGGARPQRCLWASTSVKDPELPPTRYVEALAGPQTIDTMPIKTFEALAGATVSGAELGRRAELSQDLEQRLATLGIDLEEAARGLETEGVTSFLNSYRHLLRAIEEKILTNGWDPVSRASDASFPASDAPGYGGYVMGGPTKLA